MATAHSIEDLGQQPNDAVAASSAEPVAVSALDDKTVISKRVPLIEEAGPLLPTPQLLGTTLVGQRLEHYELNEFVGGGGMGAVFRATDTRLGRVVAVKVLSRDHTDEETIRRFRNEAQSAARLDHPHIARVYYVGDDRGWNFIVFEFIEGTNLRDVVAERGPLPLEDALYYTLQIAEALVHSSSRDVVHRDIKPSNVLVTADGQVKLVDMGLARLHQVESSANDLTASGVTLGTFDYISPEQARDPRSADVRSDIYSLGCTLFYMLTGQPPFPDGTAVQKLIRHNSDEPPNVRVFRPDVHPKVAGLVARMLAKRPSQRQQTAIDLVGELVVLGEQLGLSSLTTAEYDAVYAGAMAGHWRAVIWQLVTAAAVLIGAMFVVDAYFESQGRGRDDPPRPKLAAPRSPSAGPAPNEPIDISATPGNAGSGTASAIAEQSRSLSDGSAAREETTSHVERTGPLLSEVPAAQPPTNAFSPTAPDTAARSETRETVASASLTPPAAAQHKPERIAVTEKAPLSAESGVEYAASLSEACLRAGELGISEIELQWNGERLEKPLEISNQRLSLRAAPGFHPVVMFRPDVHERQMIRLEGGSSARLAIQGVELSMQLPTDSPADDWALVAINTGQTVQLIGCVLTVQDGDADHPPIHDQVAMIAVRARRAGDTMPTMDPQLMMLQQAAIELTRSIARGEADLIRMEDETPLRVACEQSLVATSRRLLDSGGSDTKPKSFHKIEIDLEHVTARCQQGLYRRFSGKSHQFPVIVTARHCVIDTAADIPLYEFVGLTTPLDDDDLQCTGDYNRYTDEEVTFLRVRSSTMGEASQDYQLRSRWSNETHHQPGVRWLNPPASPLPAHAITQHDFAIDPALGDAGFGSAQLPEIYASPSEEPRR